MMHKPSPPLMQSNAKSSELYAHAWEYITAFLLQKSPETQRTYKTVLREFTAFLGSGYGTTKAAESLCRVDERIVLSYREWITHLPGQTSTIVRASYSSSDKELTATTDNYPPKQSPVLKTRTHHSKRDGFQTTAGNATIRKKLTIMRRIYRALSPIISHNPFDTDLISIPAAESGMKRPTQLLSSLEVTELLALPDRTSIKGVQEYCILALLFGCGLRRGEIARLAMGDIGTSRKKSILTVTLRAPKSGKDATLPLPHWAASAVSNQKFLRESQGASPRDPLFVGFTGRGGSSPTTRPISVESIYTMFLRYAKRANLALGVAPHAARATAITTLLDRGFSHRDVKNFSRHSSIQMVEIYDKRRLEIEDNPALSLDYEAKN